MQLVNQFSTFNYTNARTHTKFTPIHIKWCCRYIFNCYWRLFYWYWKLRASTYFMAMWNFLSFSISNIQFTRFLRIFHEHTRNQPWYTTTLIVFMVFYTQTNTLNIIYQCNTTSGCVIFCWARIYLFILFCQPKNYQINNHFSSVNTECQNQFNHTDFMWTKFHVRFVDSFIYYATNTHAIGIIVLAHRFILHRLTGTRLISSRVCIQKWFIRIYVMVAM